VSPAVPAACLATAALMLRPASGGGRGRLAALVPAARSPGPGSRGLLLRRAAPMAVAVLPMLLVGHLVGLLLGVVAAAVSVPLVRRLPSGADAARRRQIHTDLPLALELTAAGLHSGASPPAALAAVAGASPGPLGGLLTEVVARLSMGAPAAEAWAPVAEVTGLTGVAASAVRVADSGAALADVLRRQAGDLRDEQRQAALAAARRVGVTAVAPLGLCFLPAFVLMSVVPLLVGLVGRLLAVHG
jgi:pilus assembly protein TadC